MILYGLRQVTVSGLSIEIVGSKFNNCRCTEYYTVWRRTAEELSGLYLEGDELTWWPLSSLTSSFDILQSRMYFGRVDERTMLFIETKNSKLIQTHPHLQNDDEILPLPGIFHEAIGLLYLPNGIHTIY